MYSQRINAPPKLAICLSVIAALCVAANSQEKREGKGGFNRAVAKTTSGMNHGEPRDGLAAFLRCDRKQFRVGQPIGLTFGVIQTGPGLDSEHDSGQQPKTIWPAMEPLQPDSPSWFSVTGLDGKDVPYTGPVIDRLLDPSCMVRIYHRQFIGLYHPNLQGFDKLNLPGTYKVRWNYFSRVDWGVPHRVSNEIQFEIVK